MTVSVHYSVTYLTCELTAYQQLKRLTQCSPMIYLRFELKKSAATFRISQNPAKRTRVGDKSRWTPVPAKPYQSVQRLLSPTLGSEKLRYLENLWTEGRLHQFLDKSRANSPQQCPRTNANDPRTDLLIHLSIADTSNTSNCYLDLR